MNDKLITEDLNVINGISERLGYGPGKMLETLMYIESNTAEFTLGELRSFYHVMSEFRKLFQPKVTA